MKMEAHQKELLVGAALLGVDFVPVIGDIKSFAEAQTPQDYLAAAIGVVPVVGDVAGKAIKVGAKEAGAAGKVVDDIPATSPLARDGLREDLAAQAGIPRNIAGNPASVWGKSIDDIKQSLTMDGAILTPKVKANSSGNAKVYTVEGGTTGIKEIQYSPSTIGGDVLSTHRGEYYKLTYGDGSKVKVVDPGAYRPTFSNGSPIYDANTRYLNPQGQNVVFNSSTNTWVPE
ncbi:hypothetical protein D3C80_1438650 [compost metagenome]